MSTYSEYLGVDISKQTFDVVDKSGKHCQYENEQNQGYRDPRFFELRFNSR